MLRKWEARVPLPPQPQGPKPTSPASHESIPTTGLEATWGRGSSSTPALKPRNFRLGRLWGGGRARRERVPDAKPRCPPRSPDVCHPKEVCTPAAGYGIRLPPLFRWDSRKVFQPGGTVTAGEGLSLAGHPHPPGRFPGMP